MESRNADASGGRGSVSGEVAALDGLSVLLCGCEDGYDVVRLDGRIDYLNADYFERSIEAIAECGHPRLILSCPSLDYISHAGLLALCRLSRRLTAAGGDLAIADARPCVREILSILGVGGLVR